MERDELSSAGTAAEAPRGSTVFAGMTSSELAVAPPARAPSEGRPAELPPAPFGSSDPGVRARRLARALVSDIAAYHPERLERSLREGTVRQDFRSEVRKSWDEYVAKVGNQMALETSYFRDALNEILAGGERLF